MECFSHFLINGVFESLYKSTYSDPKFPQYFHLNRFQRILASSPTCIMHIYLLVNKRTICRQHIPGNLVLPGTSTCPPASLVDTHSPGLGDPPSSCLLLKHRRGRLSKSSKSCSEQEHFKNQREEPMRRTVSSRFIDF